MGKYFKWDESSINKLRILAKTKTKDEAAKVIGCSFNSVKKKARSLGIEFKKVGELHHASKSTNSDIELARTLRDEGLTLKSIAEKLELTIGQVRYYLSYRGAV